MARPTLHVGSAVSGHTVLFGIEQRNDLRTAKYLWPFLCLYWLDVKLRKRWCSSGVQREISACERDMMLGGAWLRLTD
jgi:hypothetical protein